jgi:hypothetical protein
MVDHVLRLIYLNTKEVWNFRFQCRDWIPADTLGSVVSELFELDICIKVKVINQNDIERGMEIDHFIGNIRQIDINMREPLQFTATPTVSARLTQKM